MTLMEFATLPDDPGKSELVRGELVWEPPSKLGHAIIQAQVVRVLTGWLCQHVGGCVLTNVGFQLSDDTCLAPDIAFVRDSQYDSTAMDDWFHGAPALAVEILSPSNTASEMGDKVRAYLEAGAEGVWVVNSKRKRLTAYHPGGHFQTIEAPLGQVANCPIFPGLTFLLSSLFAA